ncbi:NUC173 domain-containing protein [Neohortaea acidophila]|uniref:NUC173 domain-containing protein n=1 Tax=Neohortaea acidophila TaxID=245834 RepID=A0A6A6PHE5_9PEZI|nr:NUC173 domain-containing protein [Neohortaea acidophila]KAF2479023.1 NUC173 domain-containing protein [Neohortaea acidophila]
MSLHERLDKIRSAPKQQNQQQTAIVLNAIEETLQTQATDRTPTAYFAALLSLLASQVSSEQGIVQKEVAYAIVYLLDLVTSHVPHPLLRSKFPQILASLAPVLTHPEAEAPLLRASIGCLESLVAAQDSQAWALPQSQTSPRGAVGGLLLLAVDPRPKVRKRAQDAIAHILRTPPPSPSLDHPAADMCAESALQGLQKAAQEADAKRKKQKHKGQQEHDPDLLHALQLVKTVASVQNGWPSKKIDALCEVLLSISKSTNEFLTVAAFEVFELIFSGLADEVSSGKLARLLDAITELQPSRSDSQLLPPWVAVLSRGYDVSAQIEPEQTFQKLPTLIRDISSLLSSSSHNIRISASECLISLLNTCIPDAVILEPSIMDDKLLEDIAQTLQDLLTVKYQSAWMEVFNVLSAAFSVLKWRSYPLLSGIVKSIGDLRSNDSFAGKKQADGVLGAALLAAGPDNVLSILPLNLAKRRDTGRAWLLPLMRDSVSNTRLAHFKFELVPLSELMFQRVLNHGDAERTIDIKIYETIVAQIWACLPGYCQLPIDLQDAFDQGFAELLSNLLYQQPHLRTDICKALQYLVDTNQAIVGLEQDENLVQQGRVSKAEAQKNLQHLAGFAANILAVLFNVYSQTLPHNRGNLLQCINAYLSITPEQELMETFQRVATMLESSLAEPPAAETPKQQPSSEQSKMKMPPTSHTLMDLIITMSIYLPRESFGALFNMAANIVRKQDDAQLQKKAYKLIPRLSDSEIGRQALEDRNVELQALLLASGEMAAAPAKRDRLDSIARVVPFLPTSDLHFIPAILSEVVISAKEVNEKARTAAYDLLVLMGEKMSEGGAVVNAKVPHMPSDAPSAEASLEEYFTMVSAGLAGSTPHMISASITALTRLLYEFRSRLKDETVTDLVQTMDLFLTSNNREIVQSVLGFVKVSVISLPTDLMLPRLESLITNLIVWSHEHKAHFKAKVKHIFERMIRRFGADVVEKLTPLEDRKLVSNIRKTKERKKRKRDAAGDDEQEAAPERRQGKFESEYDEAVYGSESDGSGESDISDDEVLARSAAKVRKAKQTGQQYIVENEDEPLDLLDKRALAHVSSTKPLRNQGSMQREKKKAKMDLDGKLVFNENSDSDDDDIVAAGQEPGDGTLEGGINAYVNAIKGRDSAKRGQKGKLKFHNRRGDQDEMDLDEEDVATVKSKMNGAGRGRGQGRGQGRGRGRGGSQHPARRGLGVEKSRQPRGDGGIRKARGGAFRHGLQKRRGGKR